MTTSAITPSQTLLYPSMGRLSRLKHSGYLHIGELFDDVARRREPNEGGNRLGQRNAKIEELTSQSMR